MTQAYTNRFTEVHELGDWQQPMTFGAGLNVTAYESMALHQRAVYIIMLGATGAGGTLNVQLYQATDALGANAKVIPGKAIAQLSNAAGDATSICAIEVRTEELDVDGGFAWVAARQTVAGGNMTTALLVLLGASNYVPVPTTRWTEIVD